MLVTMHTSRVDNLLHENLSVKVPVNHPRVECCSKPREIGPSQN